MAASASPLTIWCNTLLGAAQSVRLEEGVAPHRVHFASPPPAGVHGPVAEDETLADADVAFGQPSASRLLECPRVRWAAISTAGITRYDTVKFREAFQRGGRALTNASSVFADPCAQHVLGMMLAYGRQLLPAYRAQLQEQSWRDEELRNTSRLLSGQSVLILGYGAIARRLVELLAPFGMRIHAVRRKTYSEAGVHIIGEDRVSSVLGQVDHIVNLLPDNASTERYVNARRLGWCRRGARFYNVGRGATVDQEALAEALRSGRLGAAYLDVTSPEPLPRDHFLWTTPNCHITPHTAGGRHDQDEALVTHFLRNFADFSAGRPPRVDRVM